jgi:acylphosphatase
MLANPLRFHTPPRALSLLLFPDPGVLPSTMRRRFVFSGRVQGVGFRATAREIGSRYSVTGWVRNDPDGAVTLEAQGEAAEIERFIADLRQQMARNIKTVTATDLGVINHEEGFHISR